MTGATTAPVSIKLNAQSNTVLFVAHSITRYGITTDAPNKWRYYLDSVEVHLPPFWEQYITDENNVELIRTDSLPLVISLNGHTLSEYMNEERSGELERVSAAHSAIRGEETEQIELLNIRRETQEEFALSRPDGMREALLVSTAFLLFFFCLGRSRSLRSMAGGRRCYVACRRVMGPVCAASQKHPARNPLSARYAKALGFVR